MVFPFSFFLLWFSPLDSCHFPQTVLFFIWVQAVASTACCCVVSLAYLLSRAFTFSFASASSLSCSPKFISSSMFSPFRHLPPYSLSTSLTVFIITYVMTNVKYFMKFPIEKPPAISGQWPVLSVMRVIMRCTLCPDQILTSSSVLRCLPSVQNPVLRTFPDHNHPA